MTSIIKVYGPPGTGKTTHLIGTVEKELAAGVKPSEIIYLSLTRAAAYEARDRACAKFTNYVKSDFQWFSTIHSICFRLLQLSRTDIFTGAQLHEFCDSYGYQMSAENHQATEEADSDMPSMVVTTTADYFELFISWMRNLLSPFAFAFNRFTDQPGIPLDFNESDLRLYIQRRNDYKTQKRLFDFTDMIELCLSNGLYPPETKVMIADEYQDNSPLLARLLDTWGDRMERVYMAGDPYQAIYQFMGADPSIFIKSHADQSVVLKQSYRCSSAVHEVSRKLVDRFNTRYTDDDFIPTNQQGMVTRHSIGGIDWVQIKGTAFYLHRTNWLLSQAYDELVGLGIPFMTLHGRQSPLQSTKARVINNIMRLADGKDVPIGDFPKMMEYIPTKTERTSYLKVGAKTNIKDFAKTHSGLMITRHELPDVGFTPSFVNALTVKTAIHVLKLSVFEKQYFTTLIYKFGYGVLNANPKVILATIHGVKGKEADNVILNTNLTHKTYDSLIHNPEPEHRLFYVAVTRAKTRLMIIEPDDWEYYKL